MFLGGLCASRSIARGVFVATGAALFSVSSAAAASLTQITPYADPLGGSTEVHGLNDTGWMTGSIDRPGGVFVGFVRDPTGHYTTFTEDVFTQGRAIDNAGDISVQAIDATLFIKTGGSEYIRHPDGTSTQLTNPIVGGPLRGIPGGFDSSGDFVGDFYTSSAFGAPRIGYEKLPGGYLGVQVPGSNLTAARGINDSGDIVGFYSDTASGTDPGFIYHAGIFQFVSHPGAIEVAFEDINNSGVAVGGWDDASGAAHPFLYDVGTGVFTDINVPGGGTAWAINEAGQVVISQSLTLGGASWLYDPSGAPEPTVWVSLIVGFGFAGASLRRRRADRFGASGRAEV